MIAVPSRSPQATLSHPSAIMVGMNDITSEITDAATAIETQRAELEPLAIELVAAASQWASEQWGRIAEKVVAASPDLVKDNAERLPILKAQLREMQANASAIAADCLEPWLLHRTTTDEGLRAFARSERWSEHPVSVTLPRGSHSQRDEPLRRLVGTIGPALNEARLLTDQSEVEAKGRYRYGLPDHNEVALPLEKYEVALKEFIRRVHAHAELERKRDSDEATKLWRDT